jgi:hypothetical protein
MKKRKKMLLRFFIIVHDNIRNSAPTYLQVQWRTHTARKHDLLAEFIPQKVAISVKNYKFIGRISLPENNANKFTGENFRKKLV